MSINLEKITLKEGKTSTSINLSKEIGDIKVNLRWNSGAEKPKGFMASLLGGKGQSIDLDLGVFAQTVSGSGTILDPLQSAFQKGNHGSTTTPPWVQHSGDDRSGGGGETLMISGRNIDKLSRVIIYTFIYEGAARWAETDAVVQIDVPGHAEIEIPMGQHSDHRTFCALAEIKFGGGMRIDVSRLMTFHAGHEECDRTYGWGFKWTAGSK